MAGIFDFFKSRNQEKNSAGMAKERLQIIIASSSQSQDFSFMPELEREILELIKKYVDVDKKDLEIKVEVDGETGGKMLELNINLPEGNKINISN